ncbi:hypothetical protein [Priestia megaterium]|uniref:hypothetical protein n=1 Tax=Priestia megaterium TaxID=1404 RepID=UPI0028775E58|nr:hypothetical protein [Priestia megaterium]
MAEEKQEQVVEFDTEQLQELMNVSEQLPPIEIQMEDYDQDEFHRGIKDSSYLAGQITALLNAGVSEGFVLDFLLNQATIDHNIRAAEINKEMNIEIAKNQRITVEKNEL